MGQQNDIESTAKEMTGTVIGGRYRLDSVLGMGGTGVVFRATCLEDDVSVSVKTVRQDLSTERAIARFFRGARLSAGLDHPGVVPTLAYGQSKGERAIPFQVMPFVDGLSLEDLATEKIAPAQILRLGCQVLDALGYVHARGVLHRDIKPANIMLERSPEGELIPRITDFGIAAALLGSQKEMNITGAYSLVGTPAYMAPEQGRSGAIDGPGLDLYALGVVLYQLLSGKLPFYGGAMEVLAAKATSEPPPLKMDDLDPSIANTIGRLIAREPRDRYEAAAQARLDLETHAKPWIVDPDWMTSLAAPKQDTPRMMPPQQRPRRPPGEETLQQHWPTLILPRTLHVKRDQLPGRDHAIQSIERSARKVEDGHLRVLSVLGDAGIGKSAVLDHVAANLVEQGRFVLIRAPFFEGGAQAGGVLWGIERMLGVQGLDRIQVASAVREFLARYDDVDPNEVAKVIDCLRPPENQTADLFEGHLGEQMALIVRLLRRLARTRPVLLMIDDADKASADLMRFLEFILLEARFDAWPILVLCGVGTNSGSDTSLPLTAWKSLDQGRDTYRSIRLHPIPNELLVQDLIQRQHITQAQAHRIARRAAGNPLHASYLAQVDFGEVSHDGTQESDAPLDATGSLPNQLLDVMTLRLRTLLAQTPDEVGARAILEGLAVLGEAGDEDLLKTLLSAKQKERFAVDLDALLELGLVGILDHAEPFVLGFTPALMRDAVLAHVPPTRLKEIHKKALAARLDLEPERRRQHWGLIGDHQAAIGDLNEATLCWLKGMRHEISRGNVTRGVNWGRRALNQMDTTDPIWAYTAKLTAALMFDAGEAQEAEAILRNVLDIAHVDGALQAGDLLCDVLENRGDSTGWSTVVEHMSTREEEAGPVGQCALYCARSMWRNTYGQADEALIDARRALELAEPGPPAQRAAQRLAFACLPNMKLDAALRAAKRSLAEAHDVPLLRTRSLRALGTVQIWQGEATAAIETLTEAALLCRRAGILTRYPITMHDLGDAYRIGGQYTEAQKQYTEAIRLCEGLPLASTEVLCRFQHWMCDIAQGQTKAFHSNIDELISDGLEVGLGMSTPFGDLLRCWAHAVDGDLPSALACFERVGSLEAISIDPQVPNVLIDISEHLVKGIVSDAIKPESLGQIKRVCIDTRNLLDGVGTTAQLQRMHLLIQRLPTVRA